MNLSRLKEELHSFQNTDWMILLVTVSLFLTQYVMAGVLILYLGWMIYKKQLWSAIKEQPGALWIYLFVFLEIIVSLFATNFTGLVNAIGMLLVPFSLRASSVEKGTRFRFRLNNSSVLVKPVTCLFFSRGCPLPSLRGNKPTTPWHTALIYPFCS